MILYNKDSIKVVLKKEEYNLIINGSCTFKSKSLDAIYDMIAIEERSMK